MGIADIKTIITLVRLPKVGIFKNYFIEKRAGTKIQNLYDGIVSDTITTDEKAAEVFYESTPANKGFMILRRDLLDDLTQSLLFYDFSQKIPSNAWRRIVCQRKALAIHILLSFGARNTATNLAERVLLEAQQLEYLQMQIECLRILRDTAAINGKITQFNKYDDLLNEKIPLYNQEIQLERECQKIEVYLINTAIPPESLAEQGMNYLEEFEKVRSVQTSFYIELHRYRILLYILQIKKEYSKAIKICNETIDFLLKHPHLTSDHRIAEFKTVELSCAIQIGRFDDALLAGNECLKIFRSGYRNWININNQIIQIHFYRGDYTSAFKTYLTVSATGGFINLPTIQKEKWFLYRGYLALFIETGELEVNSKKYKKKFSISVVIQDTSELIQDKKGLNVALIILHILYAIQLQDLDLVSTRISLLQEYAKRHLNEDQHKRTLIFISMLKILRKTKYDIQKAGSLAGDNGYSTVLNGQVKSGYSVESIEIIPYEHLWNWVIEHITKAIKV